MQLRTKRALLWGGAILFSGVIIAGAALLCMRLLGPSPQEWVVGLWEGEGEVQSQFSMKGPGGEIPPTWLPPLRSSIRAEFRQDGTMTWSQHDSGSGFQFSFTMPDPNQPEKECCWEVVRTEGRAMAVRLPQGEFRFEFRNANEFTLTYPDELAVKGTLIFHRVFRGN
jgi:hypothetical protein